ncbi:MAG TPA: hypothetical protein VIX84_21330, partial [Acidimicrobiales bacterium]
SEFIIPEDGEYLVRTYDPSRRRSAVLVDGALLNEESSNLPDGKPEVNIAPKLASGAVITTEPADAPLVIRKLDGTVLYASTGDADLRPGGQAGASRRSSSGLRRSCSARAAGPRTWTG